MAASPSSKSCYFAILCAGALLLTGCVRIIESWQMSSYDRAIRRAGDAIALAKTDSQRAAAYDAWGDAYIDKARYGRLEKLISPGEYSRLFELALQDYNEAIALAPDNADVYYRRGNAYSSRASLDMIYAPTSDFLAPAKADFAKAVEMNPKNAGALDMLGMTEGDMGDWTAALAVFRQETALDPNFRFRVSDAYCHRGSVYGGHKEYDLAVADLNQAIQMRTETDPCECEPYNPLLAVYLNTEHYDKAREVVAQAQRSKKWIEPEFLKQLKEASN